MYVRMYVCMYVWGTRLLLDEESMNGIGECFHSYELAAAREPNLAIQDIVELCSLTLCQYAVCKCMYVCRTDVCM